MPEAMRSPGQVQRKQQGLLSRAWTRGQCMEQEGGQVAGAGPTGQRWVSGKVQEAEGEEERSTRQGEPRWPG